MKELRSRLTELGLDPTGLKAELVDRLWAASQEDRHSSEILQETKHVNSALTPSVPEQTVEPPVSHGVTARCEIDPVRQYTNTSTQTEPGPSAVQPGGSQCFSQPQLVCQTEGGGLGPTESTLDNNSRGRAFYEFKEEIRYKR